MLDFLFPSNPTSRAQRTRQRILRAAVHVFSNKGYHETRVDEIVTLSKTSKGAVYGHFISKERIFLAIVDAFAAALLRRLEDSIAQAENGVDRVDRALQVCLDTFSQHQNLARIFLVQAIGLGRVFEEKRLQVHARFVSVIQRYLDQAVTEGDIPPQDTSVVAYAWLGAINETVVNWLHTQEPDLETAFPTLRRMLLRSIGVADIRLEHHSTHHITLGPDIDMRDGSVLSYTLPWPNVSLLDFLQEAPEWPRVYWSNADSPIALAGHGVTGMLSASGTDRFSDIREQARELFQHITVCGEHHPPQVGPRLIGGFSFDTGPEDEIWTAFPTAWFVLPKYQLTRYEGNTWLTINHHIDGKISQDSITQIIQQDCNQLIRSRSDHLKPLDNYPGKLSSLTSQSEWQQQVSYALKKIREGSLQKVVIARCMEFHGTVSTLRMLWTLKQRYAACYRFLFEPLRGHSFYGASPELLVELNGRQIRSVALAGSIARGLNDQEDTDLEQQLIKSKKDQNEHSLVVQEILQNLAPLAHDLRSPSAPLLLQLSNIQHLETKIVATAVEGVDILSLVESLHPTPAVGGVPYQEARDIISNCESQSRGWYSGPVGWLDPHGNGQFAVALRAALTVGHDTRLYAGSGIVANSDPNSEWEETEWKLRPFLDALGSAITGNTSL